MLAARHVGCDCRYGLAASGRARTHGGGLRSGATRKVRASLPPSRGSVVAHDRPAAIVSALGRSLRHVPRGPHADGQHPSSSRQSRAVKGWEPRRPALSRPAPYPPDAKGARPLCRPKARLRHPPSTVTPPPPLFYRLSCFALPSRGPPRAPARLGWWAATAAAAACRPQYSGDARAVHSTAATAAPGGGGGDGAGGGGGVDVGGGGGGVDGGGRQGHHTRPRARGVPHPPHPTTPPPVAARVPTAPPPAVG